MSDELSESAIVRAVADEAAQRITRKVIAHLRSMNVTMSGGDSGLKTTWDEICVQVQWEESFHWYVYDLTVRDIVSGHVAQLRKHEREAIWLQTDEGMNWWYEKQEERSMYPVRDDEIIDYLTREYIYGEADSWSNARIRAHLERTGGL